MQKTSLLKETNQLLNMFKDANVVFVVFLDITNKIVTENKTNKIKFDVSQKKG